MKSEGSLRAEMSKVRKVMRNCPEVRSEGDAMLMVLHWAIDRNPIARPHVLLDKMAGIYREEEDKKSALS
jgi:hypothetical protein